MQLKFSVRENFDEELQELFREDGQYSSLCFEGITTAVVNRKFAFIDNLEKNALLFIGLNPSRGEITQETNSYYSLKQMGDNEYSKYWKIFFKHYRISK